MTETSAADQVQATREAIRGAAVELLNEEGAPAVTFQRVAERAGVGRATVYRHYDSTTDLIEDALAHGGIADLPLDPDLPIVEKLETALQLLRDDLREPTAQAVYTTVLDRSRYAPVSSLLREVFVGRLQEQLDAALDQAMEAGELSGRPDARLVLDQLIGPVWSRVIFRAEAPDDTFIAEVVHAALRPWLPAD